MEFRKKGRGLGLGRIYREPDFVAAGDFETVQGEVYTYQMDIEGKTPRLFHLNANPKVARLEVYSLFDLLPEKGVGVIGFYFLKFDIQAMFLDKPQWFTGLGNLNPDENQEDGFRFQGCLIWPTVFVIIRKNGKKILIFDLYRFFEGGLATVCDNLKLPIGKMEKPDYLGERFPTDEETDYFNRYAIQDVTSSLQIVREVLKLFEKYNMGLKISNAHLAASIFKQNFTQNKKGKPVGLDKPDMLMQMAGLMSYHGGRNSLTVPHVPFVQENCRYYDVSSNYPFCGTKLPPGFGGQWVWDYSPREIQENGIYNLDFVLEAPLFYQLVMGHDGNYLKPGKHSGIWITGVEVLTAIRYGFLKNIENLRGFYWLAGKDFTGKHPIKEYMEHFYAEKQANKGKFALYEHSKKMLNCLYGKLISTIPMMVDGEEVHFPGAIFNAPMGSLITGWSRCLIFEAEVKYGSLHAATDSILCPGPFFPPEVGKPVMGDFTFEYEGTFVVGRNKLYAIISKDKTLENFTGYDKNHKAWYYQGKKLLKYALHAFEGTPINFLQAVFEDKTTFIARRMGNIRESLKAKEKIIKPLAFNEFEKTVVFGGKYAPRSVENGIQKS